MGRNRKAKTFQLDHDVLSALNAQCEKHAVYGSDLVNQILRRGLRAMEEGKWQLKKKPVKYRAEW